MSRAVEERLRGFAARLLERRGAVVDWPGEAAEGLALLPPPVARTLRCLEILPLAPDSASPLPVNLSSDFLDRVDPLVQAEPPVLCLRIGEAYLKRADMAEPVARAFTWLNARVRVQAASAARAEYHVWYLLATLDSTDRWQQVVRICINAPTQAQVQLPELWDVGAVPVGAGDLPAEHPAAQGPALRAAVRHVWQESRAFVERLEGRLTRDRRRIRDYYRALLDAEGRSARRRGGQPDAAERADPAKAVQLELRRKLAELDERYAFQLELTPLALARLDCPALVVRCHVLRRSTAGHVDVFWNCLTKELEPLCCSRCGVSTYSVAFSDDKLAAFCSACQR